MSAVIPCSREDMAIKAKLAQVRENDSAHEAMMQEAARKAGVNLSSVRGLRMKAMDTAMASMFREARASS